MATTFTIGDVVFGELSSGAGKYAMEISVESPQQQVMKFHPPGTNGSLLIMNGRVSTKITFRARYVGTRSDILSDFKDDCDAWVGEPIDVIDDEGTTYERCIVESVKKVGKGPIGSAGSDFGFFDVVGVISWEG